MRTQNYRYHYQQQMVALIIVLFLFTASCDRREITYYMESEIEVHADWSQSELDESEAGHGATAVFYPQSGGEPKVVLMGNREYTRVRLPAGRYDVVIFNRSFDNFAAIGFRGTEHHHTLEAFASRTETRAEEITDSPEALAADFIGDFEVTEEMLGNYSEVKKNRITGTDEYTLRFTPSKLVEEMKVTVHIKGLNNVRSAVATIDGIAASVFLATGETSMQTVTQRFELGNPQYYPGSPFDGIMTATFNSFAFNAHKLHDVHIEAQLVDGKTVFEQDVTGVAIRQDTDDAGKMMLTLEVETEKLPDVKPEEGADSGFDADVEDWGEEQEGEMVV